MRCNTLRSTAQGSSTCSRKSIGEPQVQAGLFVNAKKPDPVGPVEATNFKGSTVSDALCAQADFQTNIPPAIKDLLFPNPSQPNKLHMKGVTTAAGRKIWDRQADTKK